MDSRSYHGEYLQKGKACSKSFSKNRKHFYITKKNYACKTPISRSINSCTRQKSINVKTHSDINQQFSEVLWMSSIIDKFFFIAVKKSSPTDYFPIIIRKTSII